ncbi:MAG: hypothetical protein M3198_08115 [Actinomycetota bacterium]|nr:hypothetical protein [Actinomycetota bacterium]
MPTNWRERGIRNLLRPIILLVAVLGATLVSVPARATMSTCWYEESIATRSTCRL